MTDGGLLGCWNGLEGFIKVDLVERDVRRLILAARVHNNLFILNLLYLRGHVLHCAGYFFTCASAVTLALHRQSRVGEDLLLEQLLLHELRAREILPL